MNILIYNPSIIHLSNTARTGECAPSVWLVYKLELCLLLGVRVSGVVRRDRILRKAAPAPQPSPGGWPRGALAPGCLLCNSMSKPITPPPTPPPLQWELGSGIWEKRCCFQDACEHELLKSLWYCHYLPVPIWEMTPLGY